MSDKPRYQKGAMRDNLPELPHGPDALKKAGIATAAGAAIYATYPEIVNLLQESYGTITNNPPVLGTILAGAGVAVAASGYEKGGVSVRGRQIGRNIAVGVGAVSAFIGSAMVANEGLDAAFGSRVEASLAGVSDSPDGTNNIPVVIDGQSGNNCEILVDFNNVPQSFKDSGRYVKDAMRLQHVLKDRGFYTGEIDGDLGVLSTSAVDSLQTQGGIDVSQPWNVETCSLIPEFTDGNLSTPDFNDMPELRFPGYED